MKPLIAVSSKHGSTKEIAGSIAESVREAGIEVDVVDAEHVESAALVDVVIVGSAVRWGRVDRGGPYDSRPVRADAHLPAASGSRDDALRSGGRDGIPWPRESSRDAPAE